MGGLHESRNNFSGRFNTDSSGSFAHVAPQSKLGILSERWFGDSGADLTHSRSFRAALSLCRSS